MRSARVGVLRSNARPTLSDWQSEVDRWILRNGRYWSPLAQLARLTEEVGELAREINLSHGDKPRSDRDPATTVAGELGDVLFIILALANGLKVDLEPTLRLTLEKYDARATRSRAAAGRPHSGAPARHTAARRRPSAPD